MVRSGDCFLEEGLRKRGQDDGREYLIGIGASGENADSWRRGGGTAM